MRRAALSAFVIVLLGAFCPVTMASVQTETGKISGRVTDDQGAVLPGATVTATATDTGVSRSTTSDDTGYFTLANLLPARYDLKVELSGFRTLTTSTPVTVGATVTIDVKLQVGGVAEVVQVTAHDALINIRTQEVSTTFQQTQLRELPTITRNPYDLVALAGSVSDQDATNRGALGISLNGLRAASTNVLLDGAANNDEFTGSVGQQIPLDAVQEFSVITNNFSAQYGRASAGIVNLVVKSGTNRFSGSGYEFFRNETLATKSFDLASKVDENGDPLPKNTFNRHQYGGSLGGPIVRDKAFFFASAEYIRVRSTFTDTSLVPTPEFLARTAANTQAFFNNYSLTAPASGNVLRRADIAGGPIFNALPADLPIFQEVQRPLPFDAGGGSPQNRLLLVGRGDWAIGATATLYGRYALEDADIFAGTNANSPYSGFDTGTTNKNHNVLVSLTNVWSPRFTTQSKFVFNRLNEDQPLASAPVGPTLYLRSTQTSLNGVKVALPGYLPYSPGNAIPFGGPQNFLQVYEDATHVRGSHELRFGGSYVYFMDNRAFGAFENSVQTLGANLASALDNMILGQLRSFQGAVDPQGHFPGEPVTLPLGQPRFDRNNRYHEWALYASDAWRLGSRFTVNLGVRYEYFGVQHNTDPKLDANFYFGSGATIFEQIRNGRVQVAPDSPVGGLWRPDKNNVAPRLGFAWDVRGDGKTSLRGGYSIGYERNFGNVTFNVIQNPPNYATVSLTSGVDVPSLSITTDNAGPLAGTGTVILPRSSARHVDENIVNAYAHLWSLSFQHELFRGVVASVDYSGSEGRKQYTIEDPNAAGSAPAYIGDLSSGPLGRLNRQYSNLNTRGNKGRSRYNGLIVGVDARQLGSTGLSVNARYTLGWAKDNLSGTFSDSINNFNLGLLDPFNPDLDFGYADYDVRHRLTLGAIWELPFAREAGGLLRGIVGGWQIASVVKAQTGAPFTVYDCTNATARCMRMLDMGSLQTKGPRNPPALTPAADNPNTFVYLDLTNQADGTGAYVHPLTGNSDFGPFPSNITARNIFRRPGLWNADAILSKRFPIGGRRGLQVRLEAYNVFNHANLFVRLDGVDLSSGTQILAFRGDTGDSDQVPAGEGQRRLQLGLRFDF